MPEIDLRAEQETIRVHLCMCIKSTNTGGKLMITIYTITIVLSKANLKLTGR